MWKLILIITILLEWCYASDMMWNRRQTIVSSLKKNIKGKCKFQLKDQLNASIPDEDTFLVVSIPPTIREKRRHFNSTLPHWTHGNKELSPYFVEKGFGFDTMGQETEKKWMFHDEHPAQFRNMCIALTLPTGQEEPRDLYSTVKTDTFRRPYVARKLHAVIHPQGFVMTDCGYFQGYEGCETRFGDIVSNLITNCTSQLQTAGMTISSYFKARTLKGTESLTDRLKYIVSGQQNKGFNERKYKFILSQCTIDDSEYNMTHSGSLFQPKYYRRVFVITGLWDINYHHFVVDSLSRLARYIDFLKANPDIMIHIRAHEFKYILCAENKDCVKEGQLMRKRLFKLLGIDTSRIVHGVVMAEEVFIPRVPACGFALASSLDIRLLGDLLLEGAFDAAPEYALKHYRGNKKNLVVQQRFHTETLLRYWSDEDYEVIVRNFAKRFPKHIIIRHSSKNVNEPDYCFACDIIDYANADILVGLHGAGLTNMIFMPPGGLVVEVFGDVLDVYMTLCGYTGPLTASVGHSHYMHSYQWEKGNKFSSSSCAQSVKKFYIGYIQKQLTSPS